MKANIVDYATGMDDYLEIAKPYMTKEVIVSFAVDLSKKFDDPSYTPSASDIWLVKNLYLEYTYLPQSLIDNLSLAVNRPPDIDKKIATIYGLLDDLENYDEAEKLLEDIPTYDTDSVRIASCISFMLD